MKQLILFSAFVLFSIVAFAQNNESILVGKKETLYSKVLNENRKLWIYTPYLTAQHAGPEKRYPVLYVLDGDAHFLSTVGIVQQLSQANGNGVLPEMIIVAIENTNRLRDLTPYAITSDDTPKGNPFVNFLSSELIPYIDKNYPTAPYKVLVGHSLGGLTAIDIMTHFTSMFNAYIAIDPSMWYDNELFLNHTMTQLPTKNLKGTRLFIGIANTMYNGMTLAKIKKDQTSETQHIRSIFKLDKFLKNKPGGLQYAQKYYEQERHTTVPLLSTYDGLRFVFDYFFLDATEKDFSDSTSILALKLKKHYSNVSSEMGYKVAAPEALINYLGYDALIKKQYNKAGALFELNIESYPNSHQTYGAYADYFVTLNDTIHAIKNFKKALQIQNDATTLRKLNALIQTETFHVTPNDLQKYTGVYMLETYQIAIVLEVREGALWAIVPGQPDDMFLPVSKDVFTVKDKQGYTITFQMDGNKPLDFTSVQPNGIFKAVFKNGSGRD
jgi:predicted alpha/beta superfamily hydrolase